jgi:hypothetical protein
MFLAGSSELTRGWMDKLESLLTQLFPEIQRKQNETENQKHYWAWFESPRLPYHIAQLHPSANQIRILLRLEPSKFPLLLDETPSGRGYQDTYRSMLVVDSEDRVSHAVILISLSYVQDLELRISISK